jgi:hypothetical protein
LTEPTLLEITGKSTNRDLAAISLLVLADSIQLSRHDPLHDV